MIKAVLFDLDGTLLPMDQDIFIKNFSGLLAKKMVALKGYDPKQFSTAIWTAIGRIVKNDGSRYNEHLCERACFDVFRFPKVLFSKSTFGAV